VLSTNKVDNLYSNCSLIMTHIFQCMWFGVAPRTEYQKDMFLKEFGLRAQYMIYILGSIVNIIGALGGGGDLNEHENLHYGND
jgi:hypothetical protein